MLQFINAEFRNDKKIVYEAIKQDLCNFIYASHKLHTNKNFILKIAKENGYILKFINEKLKKDKDIINEAVKNTPNILQIIDEESKN